MEQKEREDANVTFEEKKTGSKGRVSKKKVNLAATLPTPHGRRVEPKIDAALRAKVAAASKAKQRKQVGSFICRASPENRT